MSDSSLPKRGRPRNEAVHAVAKQLGTSVRKTQENAAAGSIYTIYSQEAASLPSKVRIEIGRLLQNDPSSSDLIHDYYLALEAKDAANAEAKRVQILQTRPDVLEAINKAVAYLKAGWNDQTIATFLRQERLKAYGQSERADGATKYQRALDSLYQSAQEHALSLVGPLGDSKKLTVQLLQDALRAAEEHLAE
jgi:hypothetical protein